MAEKQYKCGYKHCLHPDSKVSASESVMVGKRHFHWDCAAINQEIRQCVNTYMSYREDKSVRPIVVRTMNTLILKDKIPTEFILKSLTQSPYYYKTKPVQILYGLRKMYWEKEIGGL